MPAARNGKLSARKIDFNEHGMRDAVGKFLPPEEGVT
jgi:hypothetical protein